MEWKEQAQKIGIGALVGLAASLPMSLSWGVMHQALPKRLQYPLPPREIALVVAEKVGLKDKIDEEPATTIAATVGHFGYSAFSGGLYAALAAGWPVPAFLKGVVFAVLLWAGSYQGWLPAVGILKPATRMPKERNAMMLASHLLWGVLTALGVRALEKKGLP